MNNSVSERRSRAQVKLVSTWEAPGSNKTGRKAHFAKTLISKSYFHNATKINDNFYAIQRKRLSVSKGSESLNLTIKRYKNVILSGTPLYGNRTMFTSKAHQLTTIKVNKKFFVAKIAKENKGERYSRVPRLSDTRYSAKWRYASSKARLKCATYRRYTDLSVMGVRVGVANFFWINR